MTFTNNHCILYGDGCTSTTKLPEFVDTAACLCGLVPSLDDNPNGNTRQTWRCIGNAADDIEKDSNGKWYNTTLPSEELSAIGEPQNWGGNPPNTDIAYVLEDKGGKPIYVELGPDGSPNLIGNDEHCTGKNDTQLSTTFYNHGNGTSPPSSSAHSSASASPTSSSGSSSAASITSAASGTVASASTTASTTSSPSPSPSSEAPHTSLKSLVLVSMLVAPLFAFTV